MEQPTYFRRLLRQRVLLIIGAVVAIAAGLLAGFTVVNGQIEPRAARTFTASTTVLLSSASPAYYQVEIPGEAQALPQPTTAPDGTQQVPTEALIVPEDTPVDLSNSAIILAYVASSDQVAAAVADRIGGFEDGEALTAVRRTTPPTGDERFGGRLELPIIDIVGVAESSGRAEEIANEGTAVFTELVVAQQNEAGIPEDIRLVLDELNTAVADEGEGGNPAVPVIVVSVGVFLLFIALALIIEAVRERRSSEGPRGRRRRPEAPADEEVDTDRPVADDEFARFDAEELNEPATTSGR